MKLCPEAKPDRYCFSTTIPTSGGNFCRFFWGFLRAWFRGEKTVRFSVYTDVGITDGVGKQIWPMQQGSAGDEHG